VGAGDPANSRKPQSRAPFGGGVKRIEDEAKIFFADSVAGIGNFDDGFRAGLFRLLQTDTHGNASPIVNRFDRIDEAGVRGEAALGLGLPLTRQFIEAHGGTIDLESKKGKGTTVTLTIPRASK